jgi:anthranilate 1,2-dioxygenase large subunit
MSAIATSMTAAFDSPRADFTRIPYSFYTDQRIFELEQERIFRGPTWNYLGLEAEVKSPGDFTTGYIGTTPYVLARNQNGELHAFVNRCAHRGAAVVRGLRGNAEDFSCIYHQWCYDLSGKLIGVPMRKGMRGVGGYPEDFNQADHGLTPIRLATLYGIVFGTFSDETPRLEEYLGTSICTRLKLMCDRPIKVTGYHRHTMRANWKLFVENTRDTYHAPMLHPFVTVFEIADIGMKATMEMTHRGGLNSLLSGYKPPATPEFIEKTKARQGGRLALEEPRVAVAVPEFDDGLALSIISIFPSCLFTLPGNTRSVRQIRPKSPGVVETVYTWFAYEDDDEQMLQHRRMQNNMFGPAGYIAMEDAEAMELIQNRISDAALEGASVVEFGGRGVEDRVNHMLSEGAIRAFWKGYCDIMNIPVGH